MTRTKKKIEINNKGTGANYTNYSQKNKMYKTECQICKNSHFRTLRKYFSLEPSKVISIKNPGHSDNLVYYINYSTIKCKETVPRKLS